MSGPELKGRGQWIEASWPRRDAIVGWFGVLLVLLMSSSVWAQTPALSPAATAAAVAAVAPVATAAPALAVPAATKAKQNAKPLSAGSDPAASSLEAYLTRVRLDNKAVQSSDGRNLDGDGQATRMSTDVRAMRPHDLISVVVSENLAASTDGTVKNSRAIECQLRGLRD